MEQKIRYEDLILLVGAALMGAGAKALSDQYDGWAMLLIGLALVVWVFYRRYRESLPPWVIGDLGIRIGAHSFNGSSVSFIVVYGGPLDTDLWITCSAPLIDGSATVKQQLGGMTREGIPAWPMFLDGKKGLLWLSDDPPEDDPYLKDTKTVAIEITATKPLRWVRVAFATPRQKKGLLKKLPPMRSVNLRPPTASGQAPPSSPESSE